jgi:AraC-like DNA-binding protein
MKVLPVDVTFGGSAFTFGRTDRLCSAQSLIVERPIDQECCEMQTQPRAALQSFLYLWPGRRLVAMPSVNNHPHRHLPASVLIGIEGPFRLSIRGHGEIETEAAIVATEIEQHMDSHGGPMLILHVDPDLSYHRTLAPRLAGAPYCVLASEIIAPLRERLRAALMQALDDAQAHQLFVDVLAAVRGNCADGPPMDRRIARIVQRLRQELPEKIDNDALAAEAGLSRSRLMHLFKIEVGTSIRRFALSLRLENAIRRWRQGMSMTTLAQDAGFYDVSHLLQAGRSYIGTLPSGLVTMFASAGPLRVFAYDDPVRG